MPQSSDTAASSGHAVAQASSRGPGSFAASNPPATESFGWAAAATPSTGSRSTVSSRYLSLTQPTGLLPVSVRITARATNGVITSITRLSR